MRKYLHVALVLLGFVVVPGLLFADAIGVLTPAANPPAFVRYIIRADATRVLPNDTNENAIFNAPTNGRVTLVAGTYRFEAMLHVTAMSATSGNALIDLIGAGTATTDGWLYYGVGIDSSTPTATATQTGTFNITQQSNQGLVASGTGTAMAALVRGTFEVTAAGTAIPSIDLNTASAAQLEIGSYVMFERLGNANLVSIGPWD